MPVILATQEAEIRKITILSQPGQIVHKTLSQKNPSQKKRPVEWLKVYALHSNPRSTKKKKKKKNKQAGNRMSSVKSINPVNPVIFKIC
jgi:hypothetical protein